MAGVAANIYLVSSQFFWLDSLSVYQVDTIRSKNQKSNDSDHVTLTCKMVLCSLTVFVWDFQLIYIMMSQPEP